MTPKEELEQQRQHDELRRRNDAAAAADAAALAIRCEQSHQAMVAARVERGESPTAAETAKKPRR